VAAAGPSASAAASVADPLSSAADWSTAPSGGYSISDAVSGSIPIDAFDPGGVLIPGPWGPATSSAEAASEVIPLVDTIPAMQAVVIGLTAFGVGWEIGSTVNTKWLHLGGVGLGTMTGAPTGITGFGFRYVSTGLGGYYGQSDSGYQLRLCTSGAYPCNTYASIFVKPGTGSSCPDSTSQPCNAEWSFITARYPFGPQSTGPYISTGPVTSFGAHYAVVIDEPEIPSTFPIDQPLQPFTNQPVNITSGWPTPGGPGTVPGTTAPPLNGGTTNPHPCFNANGARTCTGSPTNDNPNGTPLIPGIGGDPIYGNPNNNQYRCLIDPTNWACPTVGDDGSWDRSGGPLITMPDCYGLTVAACESAINGALALAGSGVTAAFSVVPSATFDPNIDTGLVASISPSAGSHADASAVVVTENDENNTGTCASETHNMHWSKNGGTMLSKGWITCGFNSPPDVSVSGAAWVCSQLPGEDQAALDAGQWGCSRVATVSQNFTVEAGVRQGPLLIGSGIPWQNAYFISTTFGSVVQQSWSQGWIPPDSGS
jgi:hypothetical protein